MEALLQALAGSELAAWLRVSRWGYAGVNAAHILGIALLVGAVLPLDLRLLGLFRFAPLDPLARLLSGAAAVGLALAVLAGLMLFSVRPLDYAGLGVFRLKLALIAVGAFSAAGFTARWRGRVSAAPRPWRIGAALVSLACWPAALLCGRLIAFVG